MSDRDKLRDHSDQFIRAGFFKLRLGKGTPLLPAAIWRPCPIEMPEDGAWQAIDRWTQLVAAYDSDSFGNWLTPCDPHFVWLRGKEIDYHECMYWLATRQHIRLHEPDAIDADPHKRIDLNIAPPIGPRF